MKLNHQEYVRNIWGIYWADIGKNDKEMKNRIRTMIPQQADLKKRDQKLKETEGGGICGLGWPLEIGVLLLL